ncbi:MAG: hypothetical protein CVV03_05810 [Firmicutes bacterium HGW-Firmicutes-8]|nr:MAG: hypothetical protein CVV03_05810 [Firmicutes bacterium HGW-Firmicutes-8]
MKRKKLYIFIGIILVIIISYYTLLTPEGAIRKYVFLKINLADAFTLKIKPGDYNDPKYGKQYYVEGVVDRRSGGTVNFFYLKQNNYGRWYVNSSGSGP